MRRLLARRPRRTEALCDFRMSGNRSDSVHSATAQPVSNCQYLDMHPYTVQLSVWVPMGDIKTRLTWVPCPQLSDAMSEELIHSCEELSAVLRAHSALVSRLLSVIPVKYAAFRILARSAGTGGLVGQSEWHRSSETGAFRPLEPWRACEWRRCLAEAA